ncbi:hypothetical protein HK102_005009 [Quaeritorhiza haematococci]|nr:hypothetical protein HK102_005009 [Quaeritorhiza haematococci]
MSEEVTDNMEEDKCVSATDSAFGIEEIIRVDFLSHLPDELAIYILSFMDDVSIFAELPLVSRRWSELCRDNEVWRIMYTKRWGATVAPRRNIPPNQLALYQNSQPLTKLQQKSKDWRRLYSQRLMLHRNWCEGNVTAKYINGHADSVYCIQFDGTRIVSGSRDRTIKFWDLRTQKCERTLRGHDGSVLCLQYDTRYIVTGSSDSSIIVWDFKTGEKIRTLRGHASPVLDVRFNDEIIVSCSKDCTIKIWELETGKLLRTLEGHHAAVNAVHLHGNLIASASGDCAIKLWDVNTGACIRDFLGHTRGLACVQFDGDMIVSGSNDKTIKIWNAHTGELVRTLEGAHGHTDLVRTLCFDKERIVSGSYDQTIKVWDMKTGELMLDLKDAHNSWVFHVQVDAAKIISASQVSFVLC